MKRLGVLGTLVWDTIFPAESVAPGGVPVESWGGLAYSLGAVSAARPDGWEFVPLLKLGADLHERAEAFLSALPLAWRASAVPVVAEPMNRVELRYTDTQRRCERLTGGVPPWRWEELAPVVGGLDALYLNFISGFEMEVSEAERLRAGFAGPIYADLHSLLLGRSPEGWRMPRPLPDRERWLRCFDAIQVNESELSILSGHTADPWTLAADALRDGPRLILVTLAEEGTAYLADGGLPADPLLWSAHRARGPSTAPVRGRVPLEGEPVRGDPTGCGDVWGATMFASLLDGQALEAAIRRAQRAAARNVSHRGAIGLYDHLRGASGW